MTYGHVCDRAVSTGIRAALVSGTRLAVSGETLLAGRRETVFWFPVSLEISGGRGGVARMFYCFHGRQGTVKRFRGVADVGCKGGLRNLQGE